MYKKMHFVAWACLLAVAIEQHVFAAEQGRSRYNEILRGTAWIVVPLKNGTASGTGWIVDQERKLLITNHHVVAGKQRVLIVFPRFKDGRVISERNAYKEEDALRAKVIDTDQHSDLAAVQLIDRLPDGIRAIPMASESAQPGDDLHSVGNPGSSGALWVYTSGTVRQVYYKEWYSQNGRSFLERKCRVLESQSPINPGDSGGPVVNDDGQLVGVVSHYRATDSSGKTVRLMSHHIDVSEVKKFVARTLRMMEPKTAEDFTLRGERLIEQDKLGEAIDALTRAIKLNDKLSAAYRHRARAFVYRGDYDTAVLDCDEAIRLDPKDAVAYEHRGLAHRRKGDIDKAIVDYSKAIQIDPKYALAYNNRGWALELKKQRDRALADYERAIRFNPKFVVAHINRMNLLYDMGRYREALAAADDGLKVNPFLPVAYRVKGRSLHMLKQYKDAVLTFDTAIQLYPDEPSYFVDRGLALTWLNRWDLAVKDYRSAIKVDPKYAAAYFWAGSAMDYHRNFDEAQRYYSKALELDPQNYKDKIKRFYQRHVKVVNNTNETLRIGYFYEAVDKREWGWYPTNLGKTYLSIDVPPGKSAYLTHEGKKIRGRRIRIWAVGLKSGERWLRDKDKDVWICPTAGYLSRNETDFIYTFK